MKNASKRSFKPRDFVYVVGCWGTKNGMQAFMTGAEIVAVNEKREIFEAVLYGDTYQLYSFKDYGRLIFNTEEEAVKAAAKIPKPQTTIYQKIGKRVYKKLILGIYEEYIGGVIDLVLELNRGKNVSIKEIGHSLFVDEADARK